MTLGPGLFVLAWLGGWAFGEITAIRQLLTAPPPNGASLFLLFWLCAWTIGGVFAMLTVRRVFQKPVPETILVNAGGITIDSGIPQFEMRNRQAAQNSAQAKANFFPKRIVDTLEARQLGSLRLREMSDGNRLTVDIGARRVELAKAATEVEREWLFKLLTERFRLKSAADRNETT